MTVPGSDGMMMCTHNKPAKKLDPRCAYLLRSRFCVMKNLGTMDDCMRLGTWRPYAEVRSQLGRGRYVL